MRTWPQSNVCSDIFDDILAKNFQSISNPMVVTQCQLDSDEPPSYAFVKGMARTCTVVALVIFLIDAGLPPPALSAEFEMSVSAIHSVYREFSSTTQILLENAGASASRSIARMWDVLTWMGVLVKLKESGGIATDPGGIIKMYNEKRFCSSVIIRWKADGRHEPPRKVNARGTNVVDRRSRHRRFQ